MKSTHSIAAVGREYSDRYVNQFEVEHEWLRLNAVDRVDSIEHLVRNADSTVESILEIGCGPGILLQELRRRGLGEKWKGIDYSQESLDHLKRNSGDIKCELGDVRTADFQVEGSFDMALLIHVLQHLAEPQASLANVIRGVNFKTIVIEVPLEDTFVNKVVPMVGWRGKNPAALKSFFSKASFHRLIESCGLVVKAERQYVPVQSIDAIKILRVRYGWTTSQTWKKVLTANLLPRMLGRLKGKLHYSHYAVLCEYREDSNGDQ